MQKQTRTIAKGVDFTSIKTDKFKSNIITVNLITPLKEETASLSSLLTDVLSCSCEKYPTLKIFNQRLAELYAANASAFVFKRGEIDVLSFTISFLDGRYAFDGTDLLHECCDFLGNMIFKPLLHNGVFSSEVVEREKKNLCDAIEAEKNNKTSYAVTRCYEEMCKEEPFSVSVNGKTEIVKAITPKSLYEHYLKVINNSRVSVYYVGSEDCDRVADEIKAALPFEPREAETPRTTIRSNVKAVKEITDEFPVTQGKLSLGFRTGITFSDNDYFSYLVFNSVFGTSPSSKLFLNVREKMSLCYYCRPVPETLKGTLVVTSGIKLSDKEKAQAAILDQLYDMQNGNITDEEIDNGKRSLINSFKEITDSPSSLISWYFVRSLAGISYTPEEAIEKVDEVTKAEITETAKKITLDTVYFMTGNGAEVDEDDE